ncbi:hypothetical protein [Pseudomonas sp.]|jgi:hypothetical protein|uniref:hypothetical protein n=1 Tax=Pseudomonas sp. TaxID=306 RepID=UPI002ED8CBEA
MTNIEKLIAALTALSALRAEAEPTPEVPTADLVGAVDFTQVPTTGAVLVRVDPERVCRHQARDLMKMVTQGLAESGQEVTATFMVVPNYIQLESLTEDRLAMMGLQRIPGFNPAHAAAAAAAPSSTAH